MRLRFRKPTLTDGMQPLAHGVVALLALTSTACIASLSLHAQVSSSVPFVGCASDGQVGFRTAPRGKPKRLALSSELANQVAWYQAQEGSGVLAPRGWHCFSIYGSDGESLLVAPEPIDRNLFFSDKWKGFSGPAIQISDAVGYTSGRFQVAPVIARVFPAYKAFVKSVIDEGIEPAEDFPFGPYPTDKLRYRGKQVVEFETPPQAEGLGTRSHLQKNDRAITGVEILSGEGEDLNLVSLAVRLPPGSETLAQAIVRQAEAQASPEHSGGGK